MPASWRTAPAPPNSNGRRVDESPSAQWRPRLAASAWVGFIASASLIQLLLWPALGRWGIHPRELAGLLGILLAPLWHADLEHLASNLLPLALLIAVAAQVHPSFWRSALVAIWLGGGLLVWIVARPANHLGASGLVYGFSALLIVGALVRRQRSAFAAALVALFLNQGLAWGLVPVNSAISYEAHACSFAVGALAAWAYRHRDLPPPASSSSADGSGDEWDYLKRLPRDLPE